MRLCDYGCGREAKFPFKNGKWCCEDNFMKCPVYRKILSKANKAKQLSEDIKNKISESLKGDKNPFYGKHHSKDTINKLRNLRKGEKCYMYGKHHSEEVKKKISKANKGKNNGMYGKSSMKGKHHSAETKRKLREFRIKQIIESKLNGNQIYPSYNSGACKLIDKYGKQHGYNFKHAENGGEFYIKELIYWVDGYDKEKNIVIEIDEKFHFDENGNLREKDVRRQKEITDFLKCKFIRIKAETGEVYQC